MNVDRGNFLLSTEEVERFIRSGGAAALPRAGTVMVYTAPLDPIRWPPTHLRNRRMDPQSRGKARKRRTWRDLN